MEKEKLENQNMTNREKEILKETKCLDMYEMMWFLKASYFFKNLAIEDIIRWNKDLFHINNCSECKEKYEEAKEKAYEVDYDQRLLTIEIEKMYSGEKSR